MVTRNVEERWSEHNSADHEWEPAKHLPDSKAFCEVFYFLLQKMVEHVET